MAFEAADVGDLRPLVKLFACRQKESILHALSLEQQVQQSQPAEQVLSSALQVLKNKYATAQRHVGRIYEYADELVTSAEARMGEIAEALDAQIGELTPPDQERYYAYLYLARNDDEKNYYFHNQIVEVAQKLNYFANLERYRAWIRISIKTEAHFEFIVSIHGYGPNDVGIMVASALTNRRIKTEDGSTVPTDVQPASVELFQFNYAESLDSTKERFSDWLESALAIALGEWKRLISA